jgi:hypothetical protein
MSRSNRAIQLTNYFPEHAKQCIARMMVSRARQISINMIQHGPNIDVQYDIPRGLQTMRDPLRSNHSPFTTTDEEVDNRM